MDSIIEVQRQTHSELERLEAALSTLLATQHKTHKDHLSAEHKASDILDRIVARSVTLQEQFQDIDGARKAEVELLTAPSHVEKELDEFYSRLKHVKDFHHRYPNRPIDGFDMELRGIVGDLEDEDMDVEMDDPMSSLFSGEERYGLCLDLYTSHTQYNNLKHIKKRLQYLQYLDVLGTVQNGLHAELLNETRHGKDYEAYLSGLYSYLLSFTKRTQPLIDVGAAQLQVEEEFNRLWEEGKMDGWMNDPTNAKGAVDGIWCPACQRSYAKQTVYDAHLSSKKHIKAAAKASGAPISSAPTNGNGQASSSTSTSTKLRSPARLTYLITALLVPIQSTLAETKANVERRFSLTARERETELVEDVPSTAPAPAADGTAGEIVEEPEEEEKIYNPLKLPLGWDGKPIPYWLYKLHGLGVEYRCEICSDHVYMGRKNFERHFQEPRHAFGMRALGLPNTKHFHEITKIEDALALAEKLKREGRKEISQAETTEEMEDEEGNVYNRKTYEDLKKQGLI